MSKISSLIKNTWEGIKQGVNYSTVTENAGTRYLSRSLLKNNGNNVVKTPLISSNFKLQIVSDVEGYNELLLKDIAIPGFGVKWSVDSETGWTPRPSLQQDSGSFISYVDKAQLNFINKLYSSQFYHGMLDMTYKRPTISIIYDPSMISTPEMQAASLLNLMASVVDQSGGLSSSLTTGDLKDKVRNTLTTLSGIAPNVFEGSLYASRSAASQYIDSVAGSEFDTELIVKPTPLFTFDKVVLDKPVINTSLSNQEFLTVSVSFTYMNASTHSISKLSE